MREEKLDLEVLRKIGEESRQDPDLAKWEDFLQKLKNPKGSVSIALVGKYVELKDAYKSIREAIVHAGAYNECKVNVTLVHSEELNDQNAGRKLEGYDGVLVAPGFGERGIEGKISAVKFARENNIPFFGICLGMQCAVVEYARNVLKLEGAHSTEIDPDSPHPVIDIMEEQKEVSDKGGTMRLGSYDCRIEKDSLVGAIYNEVEVSERHRHRFEFNNKYREDYKRSGMRPVGTNPDQDLVEIMELPSHSWFVGVQFHPEYRSTVAEPHPLFINFIKAAKEHSNKKNLTSAKAN
jgi:CTP synthase